MRQARLDDRLLDLFPPQKRTLAELEAHFMVRVLEPLNSKPSHSLLEGTQSTLCMQEP